MNALRRFAFPVFALLMLVLPALPVPEFWITQSNYIGLYALVSLGLVLLTGVAGLTSFGQAAFVGVGAYTAAFLAVKMSASPWLALLLGIGLAGGAAIVLGAITLRMSGHYLPLATIAWGLALYYTMGNMEFLGKYDGILNIPTLKIFGYDLGTGRGLHVLIWVFALLAALGAMHLLDSRPGRAIRPQAAPPWPGDGHLDVPGEADGVRIAAVLAAFPAAVRLSRAREPQPSASTRASSTCSWPCSAAWARVGRSGAGVVRIIEDSCRCCCAVIGTSGSSRRLSSASSW